jgi:hypothetical protein
MDFEDLLVEKHKFQITNPIERYSQDFAWKNIFRGNFLSVFGGHLGFMNMKNITLAL